MNLEQTTNHLIPIAKEAGAFMREERRKFKKEDIELKGKSDLVSYVDKETEKMLVKKLSDLLPEAGFITEEQTTVQETKEYTWVIDPLDGTTNFIHGIPNYCVSIGLMYESEVVSGVVYEVAQDECFKAWKRGGAYLNEERIYVSEEVAIDDCLFATGFPVHNFGKIDDYLAILNELMSNSHGLRRMGSAASDMAYVACGRYGGYFEYNLKPWDIAAGVILVKEAGGTVTDFKGGDDFLFGREMVSGGAVHPELLSVIKSKW
ncbi:MAG: inositol monophosphatase family protein [Bacteroidota bacterium]